MVMRAHPKKNDWNNLESMDERSSVLNKTDYFTIMNALNRASVDFQVLHHGDGGCNILLKGCSLLFDRDLRFNRQQEISIEEERK